MGILEIEDFEFKAMRFYPEDNTKKARIVVQPKTGGNKNYALEEGVTFLFDVRSNYQRLRVIKSFLDEDDPTWKTKANYNLDMTFNIDKNDLIFGRLKSPCQGTYIEYVDVFETSSNQAEMGKKFFKFTEAEKFNCFIIGSDDIRNNRTTGPTKITNHFYSLEDEKDMFKIAFKLEGKLLKLQYGVIF